MNVYLAQIITDQSHTVPAYKLIRAKDRAEAEILLQAYLENANSGYYTSVEYSGFIVEDIEASTA